MSAVTFAAEADDLFKKMVAKLKERWTKDKSTQANWETWMYNYDWYKDRVFESWEIIFMFQGLFAQPSQF